jgi:hypothetical protein
MPTPNEQDEEVYALLLSNKGRCKDLATYRESIIASEREAAADRHRQEVSSLKAERDGIQALYDKACEIIGQGKIDDIRAILSGQSASPKESSEPLTQMYDLGAGGIVEVPTLAGIKAKQTERGYVNKQGVWIDEPATPLQEARDDSDDWMQKAKEYMENGGCPVCFATDEDGHTADCEWGQAEKVLQEARDRGGLVVEPEQPPFECRIISGEHTNGALFGEVGLEVPAQVFEAGLVEMGRKIAVSFARAALAAEGIR